MISDKTLQLAQLLAVQYGMTVDDLVHKLLKEEEGRFFETQDVSKESFEGFKKETKKA